MLTARNKVWLPWKLLKELHKQDTNNWRIHGKDTNDEQNPAQVLVLLIAGVPFCPAPGESSTGTDPELPALLTGQPASTASASVGQKPGQEYAPKAV